MKIIIINLKEKIKEHKPKLKDNSISQYIRMLKKLENIDISNFNNIKEFLRDKKETFKKNICIPFLNYANIYKLDYIKEIEDYIKELNIKYNKIKLDYKKTKKEENNWLDWNEILDIRKKLYKQVRSFDIHKKEKKELNGQEKTILKKYTILSIYTYLPPRRLEIASLIKINKKDYDKLIETKSKLKDNYIVIKNKSNMFFSYNVYKSNRIYNNQTIEIPKKLIKVLNLWLKYNNDCDYLFSTNKKQMSSNTLSKFINNIFLPHKISVNMLRHIYITSMVDVETEKQKDKMAFLMGHSKFTQSQYLRN